MTADGAATVETLRAELARAKEQARSSNAAALKAVEELRAEKAAIAKAKKDGQDGHRIKRHYRPLLVP